MKKLFPPDFDYTSFKIIGDREATNQIEYGWIVYDLLNHFIRTLNDNIVTNHDYKLLEGQTQKLEAEVRGHIKVSNEGYSWNRRSSSTSIRSPEQARSRGQSLRK